MSAPMTPEEVREARQAMSRALEHDFVLSIDQGLLVARYAREMERHAEAMASNAETEDVYGLHCAVRDYRTKFPRTDEDGR